MPSEKTPQIRRVHKDEAKQTIINHMEIGTVRPTAYPSAWFEGHTDKPPIVIAPVDEDQIKALCQTVRLGLHDKQKRLDHKIAMAFIRYIMVRSKGILKTDWTSFGREIGKTGDQITIDNLVDFKETEELGPLTEHKDEMSPNDMLLYGMVICGIYRLCQISQDDYRERVAKTISSLIKTCCGVEFSMLGMHSLYQSWMHYQPFSQMMAVTDMFLSEFPKHAMSQLRIGTIVSKFKDCSVLLSTRMIYDLLDLEFPKLARWIWVGKVADQFVNVLKEGEEMDEPRSYSMYFMELGLSPKSPYSASVNPDLHFFYHVMGVSSGLERSRNARMVGTVQLEDIINNCMIFSYVMGTFAELGQQFSATGKPMTQPSSKRKTLERECAPSAPVGRDPDMWLGYIQSIGNRAPAYIREEMHRRWIVHVPQRDGTVGAHLYGRSNAGGDAV